MPEGHVIHRLAADLGSTFGGRAVQVTSPQGRFADAALLDGQVLQGAEAYGKHLFLDFGPEQVVHIHLGLIGKFRFVKSGPLLSPTTLRLRLETDGSAADLRGPQWCRMVGATERDRIIAALGPDPLRPDADPARGWARVSRSDRSVASLLLDQRVAAGVGNIYRVEVLFRQRLHPETPGRRLSRATWDRIWSDLVLLMPLGVSQGRIDTVRPEHTPERTGRPPRVDRHGGEVYVYRRAGMPCLVCERPVSHRVVEGRSLYWCTRCQRRR